MNKSTKSGVNTDLKLTREFSFSFLAKVIEFENDDSPSNFGKTVCFPQSLEESCVLTRKYNALHRYASDPKLQSY